MWEGLALASVFVVRPLVKFVSVGAAHRGTSGIAGQHERSIQTLAPEMMRRGKVVSCGSATWSFGHPGLKATPRIYLNPLEPCNVLQTIFARVHGVHESGVPIAIA